MRQPATETKRSPSVHCRPKIKRENRSSVNFDHVVASPFTSCRGRVVGRAADDVPEVSSGVTRAVLSSVASQRRVRRRRRLLRGSHLSSLSCRTREITTPIGRSPWTRARWTGRAGPTWTTRSSAGVWNGRLANTITTRSRALAWTTRTPKDRCVGRSRRREERFRNFLPNLATHPLG